MEIAIASGKGGTGKTTLAIALQEYFKISGYSVVLADCDVEAPDAALFLKIKKTESSNVYMEIPELIDRQCIGCSGCADFCRFNAIAMVNKRPLIFKDLCHSCGGCLILCPASALIAAENLIGLYEEGEAEGIYYTGGRLNTGQIQTTLLIDYVREKLRKRDEKIKIIDAPPGTSCPFVSAVKGCDHLLLVTEPTPFALSDLKISVEAARAMVLDFSVIINKNDTEDSDNIVLKFCEDENIKITAVISYSEDLAYAYSTGSFNKLFQNRYRAELKNIAGYIKQKIIKKEGK